jgi:glycosyltransferase involved in cell wall biosynthesis
MLMHTPSSVPAPAALPIPDGWKRPGTGALRVCHVMSADLWAGAEVQVATTASYLIERPEVVLSAVLFNDGPLAGELRRLGVPVSVLDESRTSAGQIVQELTRLLRLYAVDIVHTHRYKDTVLGAMAAALAGVPGLVRTVHGRSEPMRGWAQAKYRVYDTLDRAVLRWYANGMIAVSTVVAKSLEPLASSSAPVISLPNGINLSQVRPARFRRDVRHELGVDAGTPLVGAIGRLSPVKGHATFLEAARATLEAVPGARFVLVGDGELAAELKARAARLGIDRACAFLGARHDVYDLLSAMDVFVLPSLDEGIPMALLEAMAIGTPVVATAVGGVPEVVTDGTTGLLVPPADPAALAAACLALIRDRQRAQSLAARARDEVVARFSHERHGARLVDFYRQVMAGAGGASFRPRLQARVSHMTRRRR